MTDLGPDLRIKQDTFVRDKVVDVLRQAILDGFLKPGRRLTEKELTELTGVSRTSVREALRRLQAERLVEESPSRGLRVALLTAEEIEQIYEVRAELEPLAVRLFVERASQQEIDELTSIIEECVASDYPTKEVERLDRVLLQGGRNPTLQEVLGGLYGRIHALRRVSGSGEVRMPVMKQEYANLGEAIQRRSVSDAVRAARAHVAAATESAKVAMSLVEQDPGAEADKRR